MPQVRHRSAWPDEVRDGRLTHEEDEHEEENPVDLLIMVLPEGLCS